jgi:hypothetical protein
LVQQTQQEHASNLSEEWFVITQENDVCLDPYVMLSIHSSLIRTDSHKQYRSSSHMCANRWMDISLVLCVIVALMATITPLTVTAISCRDPNGQEVDWWMIHATAKTRMLSA